MTLGRMVLVGCLSLVGSALVGCGLAGADRVGEGRGNVVEVPPTSEGDGCTLTQGYWKNHEESWPVSSLTIGGVAYSQEELLDLFRTPPKGDASLILGHQLIAAMLNVASGASDAALDGALAEADAWMAANKDADGRLPYGVKGGSAAGEAVSLSEALADFNEGGIGPGHCDDGPGSSTGGADGGAGGSHGGEGGSCGDPDGGAGGSDGGTGGSGGDTGGEGGSDSTCSFPCGSNDDCFGDLACIEGCCQLVVK
ncbi:hypothetical protein [Sorangium sp. So ce1024]|uniref:hypothetical protein n=1 Tax=Sorangium sp. So ce1024 TaxID=3133327 RepID=UPI003F0B030F